MKNKKWYNYLWIFSSVYMILGLFNITFALIGLICFILPILIAVFKGNKSYCNLYCGRGQLLSILGQKLKLSRNKEIPSFLRSKKFRYIFLTFFMTMFGIMIYTVVRVFNGADLKTAVTFLWAFKIPWFYNEIIDIPKWLVQFCFGFYSIMLTSTFLGLLTMVLYKPRSWCVYCPMGTMTQGICILKNKGCENNENESKKNGRYT